MNRNTLQLFYFSAWGIIILTILYLILLLLPLLIGQKPEWRPAITSYNEIETSGGLLSDFCGLVFFLLTPLILILFNCFHDYASRSVKIFSSIALCLIVSSTALSTFSYIIQFALRGFNIHAHSEDSLIYHTYSLLNDFSTLVYFMAITVLVGLAELFIIPIFSKTNNIENNIRLTLIIASVFNLLSALMFILEQEGISASCMLVSLVFFTIFSILCIKLFKRSKSQEYEE